jgi:phage host-nuclease inhibitor protein Gam
LRQPAFQPFIRKECTMSNTQALATEADQEALSPCDEDASDEIAGSDAPDSTDPDVPEQFVVQDSESANWVIRKINEARAYRKAVASYAAREMKRAEREEEFFLFRFERQLRDWAASEVAKLKGRRKTINLPAGSLSFRHAGPSLVIDDDQAVIEWARISCPRAVQISERLSRSIVKEHFAATGELAERGVHVDPAREVFRVS